MSDQTITELQDRIRKLKARLEVAAIIEESAARMASKIRDVLPPLEPDEDFPDEPAPGRGEYGVDQLFGAINELIAYVNALKDGSPTE